MLPAVTDVAEYAAPPLTCTSVGNVLAMVTNVADAPVIPVKSPAPATATVVDVASELSKKNAQLLIRAVPDAVALLEESAVVVAVASDDPAAPDVAPISTAPTE